MEPSAEPATSKKRRSSPAPTADSRDYVVLIINHCEDRNECDSSDDSSDYDDDGTHIVLPRVFKIPIEALTKDEQAFLAKHNMRRAPYKRGAPHTQVWLNLSLRLYGLPFDNDETSPKAPEASNVERTRELGGSLVECDIGRSLVVEEGDRIAQIYVLYNDVVLVDASD